MHLIDSKQTPIRNLLQQKLGEHRERNPHFSARAFAKKLGLSPGALSEILNGNRIISQKIAERLCDRLFLDPSERSSLLEGYTAGAQRLRARATLETEKISADSFKLMSEWQHFAILSFMNTSHFLPKADYVADRLGISETTVERALQVLIRLGMIQIEPNGNWTRLKPPVRTSDGTEDLSIRKNHQETLDLARGSMEQVPYEQTDYTSLTFPLDVSDLPAAKRKIRIFQAELFDEFNSHKKPREVYRLAMQLFPLTKVEQEGQNQ